uniref:Uncharacterized protein n=1 Tax=Kalanchoe fedtschenkoi TaxID=63787 RepID=A0A7N0REQ0_KALFE
MPGDIKGWPIESLFLSEGYPRGNSACKPVKSHQEAANANLKGIRTPVVPKRRSHIFFSFS